MGPALTLLPELPAREPFDVVFLDAAKAEYPQYLDWALKLVRPGGLILADNTLIAGAPVIDEDATDPGIRGVREFNRRIATDSRLASIVLPVREGVSVSLVRAP